MSESPSSDPRPGSDLPPDLRLLRALVTVLTGVMIVGIASLVALFWLRFPAGGPGPETGKAATAPPPALPDTLALPPGASAQAVTAGPGWWAVVTEAGDILLYGADGALLREIAAEELSPR